MRSRSQGRDLVTVRNVRHETLTMSGDALKIVVVADTHSEPHPRSAELIAAEKPDRILHAGDIGALRVLDDLAKIAPVWAVRGNIDVHAPELADALTVEVRDDEGRLFKLLLLHIAVNGPRLRADAARQAKAEGATVVVCGHSHVPFLGRDRDLTMFNPGSIGPRRFQLPILFGVIDVNRQRIAMRHIDCETGRDWSP